MESAERSNSNRSEGHPPKADATIGVGGGTAPLNNAGSRITELRDDDTPETAGVRDKRKKMKKLVVILCFILFHANIGYAINSKNTGIVFSVGRNYRDIQSGLKNSIDMYDIHLNCSFINVSHENTSFSNTTYIGLGLSQLLQFQYGIVDVGSNYRIRSNICLFNDKSFLYTESNNVLKPRIKPVLSIFLEYSTLDRITSGIALGVLW